jgi:hypothetical protein
LANRGRPSVNKRLKEAARKQRQQQKAEKRAARAAEKQSKPEIDSGEDPDIAGIVPGPQPLPEEFEG